jgi:hypothetical protein
MPETRFRKLPIEITAIQWTGDNEAEIAAFTRGGFTPTEVGDHMDAAVTAEVYDNLHSTWTGDKTGQWIIRGVQGEHYPIDETVLAETYERLPDA